MKKMLTMLMTFVFALSLIACGSKDAAPVTESNSAAPVAKSGEESSVIIGVDYATSDKYNLQIVERVDEICQERGWTCLRAEGQRDAEKTLANVDSFILKGAKYVLVIGVDENLQTSVQEKCKAADVIPVFTAGPNVDGFTVANGNGSSGEMAAAVCEILAAEAKERWGSVDLAIVTINSEIGQDANEIFDACAEVYNRVLGVNPDDIVVIDCPWDNMKASELFTNMFTAHPDAEHIIAYGYVDLHHGVPLYNAAKVAGKLDNLLMGGTNVADDTTPACMQESPNTWLCQVPCAGQGSGQVFMDIVIDHEDNGTPIEERVYMPTGAIETVGPDEISSFY